MESFLPRCRLLGAAVLLLASVAAAMAAPPQPAPLAPQDTLELQRIAAYLNNIRTMTARFRQVAHNGGQSSGHVWVARPGRMRFEYDPPTPIALLADASNRTAAPSTRKLCKNASIPDDFLLSLA